MNLRAEFEEYLRLFKSEDFRQQLLNCSNVPVSIPNITWRGLPNDLLTLMLQRSISGLESYLCAAVEYELQVRGKLTAELKERLENPFSFNSKAAVALFEKMPELIDPQLKLSRANKGLYDAVESFYKKVRNPLFHGNQIKYSSENFDRVESAFQLIADVYDWIDSWYSAFTSSWKALRDPKAA